MEAYFGLLESKLAAIPMPSRQLYILASRKLLGRSRDDGFIASYAAALSELDAAGKAERGYVQILETCIEAFGRVSTAVRNGRVAV
ncbi:MAG: hypothetical protein CVV47_13710 [Spirochaetae bacterium HGW-Spirochaetae-3]|jgi:hypothetical protein|nr:MAG: hypothetical protein CVV47_13710 [Spirochaetae bacterium HGW-Spirochaetae-3]